MPINSLGYPCIKELQRDNLLYAYNMPINIIQCCNIKKVVGLVYTTCDDSIES